jgi:hypothetical protein
LKITLGIEKILITQGISSLPLFGTALAYYAGKFNPKEGRKMKTKIGLLLVAGAFAFTAALPITAMAARSGKTGGQALQTQTQTQPRVRDQQRLRDGSCADPAKAQSGTMQKKGNIYGPGDGTGNSGVGPKDGTGYGAPSQR